LENDCSHSWQPIGLANPMIAAIALHHGLELVTGNTAHIERIQQLGYPQLADLTSQAPRPLGGVPGTLC
jgi:predicted nucleic acid-binding protein